jgi:hypothetical protein
MSYLIPYSKVNSRNHRRTAQLFQQVDSGPDVKIDEVSRDFSFVDSFTGFKQPGWRQLILNGGNATTPASGTKQTFTDPIISGYCTIDNGSQKVKRTAIGAMGALFGEDTFLPIDGIVPSEEIDNRALVAFLKKCKAAQKKISSGVVLGELKETLHLIKKPASSLRELVTSYVSACRRGTRGASPSATLRHLRSQWLEFSFGARPLVSDLNGGLEALLKHYYDLPSAYVYQHSFTPFSAHSDTIYHSLWSQFIPVFMDRITYRKYGRKIVGKVRLMTTGTVGPIVETLGLTLPDFFPTVYQLIPYSFLVDYFTNIGDILEAASFNRLDLIWHCDVRYEKAVRTVSIKPNRPSDLFGVPVVDYSVSPSTWTQQFENFTRSADVLGVPYLGTRIPGNWSQFLNIGALASLRFL